MSVVNKMDLTGRGHKPADFSDVIMGIDLGTTNSAVSVFTSGVVPTLCQMGSENQTTLQSCVRWDGGDKFTVGPDAYAERYKDNVCYSVKRIMGSGKSVTFAREGETLEMSPAQVSAEILKALASKVEDAYGRITKCVITVPAYFNQRQIEDTITASKLAGLDCIQVLKEPTSASYIYSNLGYAKDGSILVYDLGGGTFDVTHMSFLKKSGISKKTYTYLSKNYGITEQDLDAGDTSALYYCRVLGTYGDMNLGGDDIDAVLAKNVCADHGIKLADEEFEELKLRCEQFKKSGLSGRDIWVGDHKIPLRKEDLWKATHEIFDRTLRILEQISDKDLDSVGTIVLVGGSTKSPMLIEMLEQAFPGKEISRVLDPDATVALGAGSVARDLQEGKTLSYQDVLPMAIGVLDGEKTVDICIPRNTAMPYTVSKTYYTMHDNQDALVIEIYQGVTTNPKECTHLGKIRVTDLPHRPAGELSVKVYFMLSAQGRLTVRTNVDGIEEEQEITIDSIFDVKDDKGAGADIPALEYDDYERSIASMCEDNPGLVELVLKRRAALEAGDVTEVDRIENKILEEL